MTNATKPQAKPAVTAPAPKPASTAPKPVAAKTKPEETGAQKFQRIGASRVKKVLSAMRLLETVGRSPSYDYTDEQAAKLLGYLRGGLDKVEVAFTPRTKSKDEPSVSL
jgi:hypothetical protein